MYMVYCPDCGYYTEFADDEVKHMFHKYRSGYKKYGLPEVIIVVTARLTMTILQYAE